MNFIFVLSVLIYLISRKNLAIYNRGHVPSTEDMEDMEVEDMVDTGVVIKKNYIHKNLEF